MTVRLPEPEFHYCTKDVISNHIAAIDPRAYDKTRNNLDGAVTWLSPFLSHGIITTVDVATPVLQQHKPGSCYRLLFELAWREYFHRVWQLEEDAVFDDMRQPQERVASKRLPQAVVDANTGIHVVDESLQQLAERGLMHNHARLWVAAMTCNMAYTHWSEAARWMHYQLLDGDLASNTLSWQWVAGTFSHKRYVANQQNINRYSNSEQHGSWLDVPYEAFDDFDVPDELRTRRECHYSAIPDDIAHVDSLNKLTGKVALRCVWHLDPHWQPGQSRHIIFVDEALHERWPMNSNRWTFIRHWADACGATLVRGSVDQLHHACGTADVVRQEYPACNDWPGVVEPRPWLYPMPDDEFNSFSQFFKQVKKSVGL